MPLDSERIIEDLQEAVAGKLDSYEPRKSQLDLLELIIRAFNEDCFAMAEAGTGVGKSFAYLLPAMRFAADNKDRVVISTATITLQQQLFDKDIPLVAQALGLSDFKAVVMKGRGNYLCLRRLDDALKDPPLDESEFDELKNISEWAQCTKRGEKAEITFQVTETAWSCVCSDSDMCPGLHCQWQDRCFVFALRREAGNARIIVANHHLLFADLAARFQGAGYENAVVLPSFNRLIVDEAHTVENAATSFFSQSFSRFAVFRRISRLYHKRGANRRGLLVRLCALLPSNIDPLDDLAAALEKIRSSCEELDERALELCGAEGVLRISHNIDIRGLEISLFPCLKSLRKNIIALCTMIRSLLDEVEDDETGNPVVLEIKSILKNFDETADICASFPDFNKHENIVFWIERRKNQAVFTKSPLDLAPILKDSLFEPNKTVVCVSATLTVNGDFTYWAGRCGIAANENRILLKGVFPSPFPYSSAVLLAAPLDAPLPDEEGYQDFINMAVGRLSAVAGGSALILFTSYLSLANAYSAAQGELQSLGIRCLKQGDDDRSRLLQDFLSDKTSCLFATSSFWEGIDAPGDTLRLVILCRLPFRTPGDPVFEARCEALQKAGGNPFMQLSLPQAVMKFKQGFGRLIRRSEDHGIVAVLDGRLLKKQYGRLFSDSLPETKTSFCNFENNIKDIENFLYMPHNKTR
jgi:ATP-dependent DNA helicase DinG